MANYQWKADTDYRSSTTLSHGVNPSGQMDWQTAEIGVAGSGTWEYWFRDSNTTYAGSFQDLLSSRCVVSVSETWNTSVDTQNNLTVTITTTLNSIIRDDIRHPAGVYDQDTPGRDLNLYREEGGTLIRNWRDNQVATAHTIFQGPLVLDTYTFILAPGQNAYRPSLFLHNQVVGATSFDDIGLGVSFRNPLPADYRPGERKVNGAWMSHNRTVGKCERKVNGVWTEMRTLNGGVGTDNPPSRKQSGLWYNQRKVGQE